MTTSGTISLQATGCPACALPAEIVERAVLESTHGPVEHARVRCVGTHVFNLPVSMLATSHGRQPCSAQPADHLLRP